MRKFNGIRNRFWIKAILFSGLVSFSIIPEAKAQTREELQQKKEALRKEIEKANKILEETRQNKNTSLSQLIALNKKISTRAELIRTIQSEVRILQTQISRTQTNINALEADLKVMREEYARIIYFAFKNRSSYQRLMFVFSSRDFNQAYKRLRYLQQYTGYRVKQKEMIEKTQASLAQKVVELELRKEAKSNLLAGAEVEKEQLSSEKTEQVGVLESLQKKERELKSKLAEKQKAERNLNKAIEDIIRREIEEARRKADKEGNSNANASAFSLTPEARKLSESFSGNRGKLPWPVEQGVITETFGIHPHPVLKGIETNNNGVDIGTHKGATARAIFDGEVSGVISIPGSGRAVLVRHGEYLSVYSNLENVKVSAGQKVSTKETIGTVLTRDEDAKTELNLQIWKNTTKMDPEAWLFKTSR